MPAVLREYLVILKIINAKPLKGERTPFLNSLRKSLSSAMFVYVSFPFIIYALVLKWKDRGQPKFCGMASDWSILTIVKPVRPAVGWGVPRAHRNIQPVRLQISENNNVKNLWKGYQESKLLTIRWSMRSAPVNLGKFFLWLLRLFGILNLFIFNRLICLSHLLKPASVCVTNIHYYPYAVKENQENLVFHKIKSSSISYDT